jgi:hypothetical protein
MTVKSCALRIPLAFEAEKEAECRSTLAVPLPGPGRVEAVRMRSVDLELIPVDRLPGDADDRIVECPGGLGRAAGRIGRIHAEDGPDVFLISVEDMADQLPPATLSADKITLTVLWSWRVLAVPQTRTFADVVSSVNCTPAALRLPHDPAKDSPAATPLSMSFIPAPHDLRVGGPDGVLVSRALCPLRSDAARGSAMDGESGVFAVTGIPVSQPPSLQE